MLKKNTKALSVEEFETEISKGTLVLDVRSPDDFEKGFVPNAINIGLNGQYAPWVGALLDASTPLILVTDEGKEAEAVLRLARVGYENVNGYLNGGISAWKNAGKATDAVHSVTAEDFVAHLSSSDTILDVRKSGEVESGMIENANHICLSQLQSELHNLDKNKLAKPKVINTEISIILISAFDLLIIILNSSSDTFSISFGIFLFLGKNL